MVGRAVTTVGCRVDWDGWKNLLYGTTVVAEEWEGERRWVEIRVDKFAARWNLWLLDTSRKLRKPTSVDVRGSLNMARQGKSTIGLEKSTGRWQVESLLRKKLLVPPSKRNRGTGTELVATAAASRSSSPTATTKFVRRASGYGSLG